MKSLILSARRRLLFHSRLEKRLDFDAAILMYHRFSEDAIGSAIPRRDFAEQLDYLVGRFTVVPLAEILTSPGRSEDGRQRVALTVDDGYRSVHEVAWPELRARELAATVFLPTEFIDQGGWMWQDRNIYLLRHAPGGNYRLAWRGEDLRFELGSRQCLMAALERVYEIGRHLDAESRWELTATLSQVLGVELPKAPPALYAPMTWDQVHEMQAGGISFGSHTVTHAILNTMPADAARLEIEHSREILANRLGRPVEYFAYPNGDFDATILELTRSAGYSGAVTTLAGFWPTPTGDRFVVPRLPAPMGGGPWLADRLWSWSRIFGSRTTRAAT